MNRSTFSHGCLAWVSFATLAFGQAPNVPAASPKPATQAKGGRSTPTVTTPTSNAATAQLEVKPEAQLEKTVKYPQAPLSDYYKVEKIALPPGLSPETGGIACLPDGRVAACFHRGEVYLYDPVKQTWKLFAEGLHDPLGIYPISDHEMVVMQRPELTRLRDTDGDGVADEYTTITDAFGISGNYHEFAFGPVMDKEGNFLIALNVASNGAGIHYEVRGPRNTTNAIGTRMYSPVAYRGWVMKVTPRGELLPFAAGFRSPNGLGFDAEGRLYVPDNQGDWRGTSPVFQVEEGKFYGHPHSLAWRPGEKRETKSIPVPELEKMRTPGALLFPQGILANSPTQPLLDSTHGKFGPFAGQMLIGDYTRAHVMRMMLEKVDGQVQGAAAPLISGKEVAGGINRLAFAPDGSLWVGNTSHGWGGTGGLSRVTWTGKVPLDILEMHLTKTGFTLRFTKPVQAAAASLPATYKIRRYWYDYGPNYGSPQRDLEDVPVKSATLSPDRLTVTLDLGELVAWRVYEMHLDGLKDDAGAYPLNPSCFYTLNHLLEHTPPPPVTVQKPEKGTGGAE